MRKLWTLSAILLAMTLAPAAAAPYKLLTGVDVGLWPGIDRSVNPIPGPGFPGTFRDGDRLAGTSDTGSPIAFQGIGTPLHPPNHLGTLSFLFRRGSLGIPPNLRLPIMGIEFLGGPLLDLDGDLTNGSRSLVPVVDVNGNVMTPVEIPGTFSQIDLSVDFTGGVVSLNQFDATGSSEGAQGINADTATTVTTLAGTTPTAGNSGKINPAFDTRSGTLTPFPGNSGTLSRVWRIDGLQVELWFDTALANSATAADLGTFQYFCTFRGWLIARDCATGMFPTLAGEGLGSTAWPAVDISQIGNTFNTAINVFGSTAAIGDGVSGDLFTEPGNGGLAFADAGGDLGAYLDSVVAPLIDPQAEAVVYLESAGFGINNSGDPVFTDSTGYDAVVIAAADSLFAFGDVNTDNNVDISDAGALVNILLDPGSFAPCDRNRADVNGDGATDGLDIQALVNALL